MRDRAIKTAIQKMAGTFKDDTVQLFIGTVESVDEDKARFALEFYLLFLLFFPLHKSQHRQSSHFQFLEFYTFFKYAFIVCAPHFLL